MKMTCVGLLAAAALLLGAPATAGVMAYGGTVLSAPAGSFGLLAPRLFDQSGLSKSYVSGTTDFTQYAASGVTHLGSSTTNGTGYYAAAGATVDIDLGQTLLLRSLALWNDNDAQGVKNFSLSLADNPAFANAVSLGSFVAQYGYNNTFLSYSRGTAAQLFDLNDAVGRYVRIKFETANSGSNINVGELVFGAQPPQEIPEPGTIMLTGLGLLAVACCRRRSGTTK
ncbi:PEP-CTERM sorting domain-containing protein [Pseudoduganella eburnea]|uniref:PEP-CTERM sorting domain-containing protein n=1 Tax=Massilia eburnea TaxID=1776165 RepID=A0A6L6QFV4_9BURK|nr:PEP-CTERM sorting domain-containing protein [Massilia eburnea]MTW11099.1 PEP-CTERM sorting domain-containing protein [Massilia eburnea]